MYNLIKLAKQKGYCDDFYWLSQMDYGLCHPRCFSSSLYHQYVSLHICN